MPMLVLFDIDGTLMRGATAGHRKALLAGVEQVTGRRASFDGIDTAGRLDMDIIAALVDSSGDEPGDAGLVERIAAKSERAYLADCHDDLRPFVCRGARELLTALSARGAALALVSGNLGAIGWRKVELAGLKPFFRCGAFSGDGATRSALAKLAAVRACAEGHAAHDFRISLIGDHRNDVEAARANGFYSIAVASGPMSAAELRAASPDTLIDSLADLDPSLFFDMP